MKNWTASLVALATSALAIFAPQVQTLIAAHPAVSAAVAGVYAVISHLLPSPVADANAKG